MIRLLFFLIKLSAFTAEMIIYLDFDLIIPYVDTSDEMMLLWGKPQGMWVFLFGEEEEWNGKHITSCNLLL